MDFASIAAGGVAGLVGKAIDNATQYYNNKHLQSQAQHDTEENMETQAQLEDESWANRILRYPKLLRDSGLSPVLAKGTVQGAATTTPGAPMASTSPSGESIASNIQAMKENELLNSQKELNEATAKKAKAEARRTELQNIHTEHEDQALEVGMYNMLDEMRSSTDNQFMRGFLDTYLDNNETLDLGAYNAFNKMFYDLSQRERDRELDFIQKEFDKRVVQMQYENGAAAALADMPKAKRLEIYSAVNQMNSNIARMNAETSLTEDQRDKLRSETAKLAQEVQSILHSDPAAMYKAGDISSLLVTLGYDAVKAASAGAGFAAGAALTKGAAAPGAVKAAPSLGSKTLKTTKGIPQSKIDRVNEKARQIDNPVHRAQYIDKSMRELHRQYD